MSLPAWCTPPEPLVGREEVIAAAVAASAAGPITLVGPAGAGVTVAAGAVVERLLALGQAGRAVAVRVGGCHGPDDVVRAIGLALDVAMPGDEAAVGNALDQGPRTVVLVDDADRCAAATRLLVAAHPETRFVLAGREPVMGAAIDVPPLPDDVLAGLLPPGTDPAPYRGLPLLARLPSPPTADEPWAAVDALLPPGAEILAGLPMGVPDGPTELAVPPDALRLPIDGRIVLRRSVRDALGGGDQPSSEALSAALRDRLEEAHAVALGASAATRPSTEELLFFRAGAARIADPDLAALAAAAAARLLLRLFQPSEALAIVRANLADRTPIARGALGLLRWLEGDALLDQGADEEAQISWRFAAESFADPRLSQVLSSMSRRCAERFAARGDFARARRWLAEARNATRPGDDPLAWGDALRIAGDLAAQARELVGAASLYDEALAAVERAPGGQRERAAVRVGQAGLEVARGQYTPAEELLASAADDAAGDALLEASIAYRRAELAMRRGRRDEARPWLEVARSRYLVAGAVQGLLLQTRLAGDLEALGGDRAAAVAHYQVAIDLCVRQRDLFGLQRVLRHLLAVEREGLPGPHIDEVQARLDLVEVLMRVR